MYRFKMPSCDMEEVVSAQMQMTVRHWGCGPLRAEATERGVHMEQEAGYSWRLD